MNKAIIIGATSGIGKGLAQQLANNNYQVGITGRRQKLLEDLAKEKPGSYIIKSFDISETGTIAQNLEELMTELKGLDLFVISSGTGEPNEHLDFQVENRVIGTNVLGFTFLTDWAFNYFRNQKYGHLVAITSIAGYRGYREALAYNATKAFQICYLEGLRNKAAHQRLPIVITDVRPGFVDTAMARSNMKFWVVPVEKAVGQIYRNIERKKRIIFINWRWRTVAFLFKLLPNAVLDRF